MSKLLTFFAAICLPLLLNINTYSQNVAFNFERWEIRAEESRITDHLGRPSLYLKGGISLRVGVMF